MPQITSVEVFEYSGFRNIRWALAQMREFHPTATDIDGLEFYKLLGSGAGNGFSIWPDFSTFVFLSVWESEAQMQAFRTTHNRYREMLERCKQRSGALLTPIKGHGTWNGLAPFYIDTNAQVDNVPLAVLTRASISRKKALRFWRRVPGVSKHITNQPGLLWAKGVGELPLVEQATLSIWSSQNELQNFAYGAHGKHNPMVKMTRKVGWYDEEMFVRFRVEELEGGFSTLVK